MKINFKKSVIKLTGEPAKDTEGEDLKLNEILGDQIANHFEKGTNGLKYYDWATRIYRDGTITLERADVKVLEQLIPKIGLSVLVQGQAIECIDAAKEKAKDGDK